jgi:hypothetical protein
MSETIYPVRQRYIVDGLNFKQDRFDNLYCHSLCLCAQGSVLLSSCTICVQYNAPFLDGVSLGCMFSCHKWECLKLGKFIINVISPFQFYEGNSKINLRLVGKKKRVVIAPKRKLSSNKYSLSLNVYCHTFSLHSVGVITDETWTLSSPLPPAARYVLLSPFFTQKDSKGILLTKIMAPGTTIKSEVFCETLNKLRRSNQTNGRDAH